MEHNTLIPRDRYRLELPPATRDDCDAPEQHDPPLTVPVLPDGIPSELRERDQWVSWCWEWKQDKKKPEKSGWTKVPKSADRGVNVDASDPGAWRTFTRAMSRYEANRSHGVGFAVTPDDPYVGIDLDKCRDPDTGTIDRDIQEWIDRFDSYTEVTPSGTGVRVWVRGVFQRSNGTYGNRKGPVEVYSAKRYFTVTGQRLPACPTTIELRQPALDALIREFGLDEEPRRDTMPGDLPMSPPMSDDEIFRRASSALNRDKFNRLWAGDTREYADDDSAADLALVGLLSFWTQDEEQLDRLFRQSGLYREKWDRDDYRERTIAKALDRDEVYQPRDLGAVSLGRTQSDGECARISAPPFPMDIFPPTVRRYLTEAAESNNVPPEMVALPFLANTGALIGNRLALRLKADWRAYPSLWVAVVAPPGSAKSPALKAAGWPLREMQTAAMREYRTCLAAHKEAVAAWRRQKREERGPEPTPPTPRNFRTTNTTTEGLFAMLADAPGIAVDYDELSGFVAGLDQYKGKGADRQIYLSLFNSSAEKIDRKGAETIYCEVPVASIVGGIQPDLVPALRPANGSRDGFIDRFLVIVPECAPAPWSEAGISTEASNAIMAIYRQLDMLPFLDLGGGPDRGLTVELSPAAKAVWRDWYNDNHTILAPEQSGLRRGFSLKRETYVPRLALLLHALHRPNDSWQPISAERMEDAIELAEFLRAHTERLLALLGNEARESESAGPSRIMSVLEQKGRECDGGWVMQSQLYHAAGCNDAAALISELEEAQAAGRVEQRKRPSKTKHAIEWRIVPRISRDPRSQDCKIARSPDVDARTGEILQSCNLANDRLDEMRVLARSGAATVREDSMPA